MPYIIPFVVWPTSPKQMASHRAAYEKSEQGDLYHTRRHGAEGAQSSAPADAPFELPDGWAWAPVDDVTELKRGRYITRSRIKAGGIPVILGGQEPAYYCDESNHDGPCVVVSRSGASAGYASYWDCPIFVTDGFLFECHSSSCETRYFFYWLRSLPLDRLQRGTGIPHVRSKDIKALSFPLPPLAEQRRIVARVEELFRIADSLGKAADGLAETAKRLNRKILDLAIRGKLVPQDPTDEPASELLKRIAAASHKSPCQKSGERDLSHAETRSLAPEDSPFAVPKSWAWVRLRDLGVFCGGHTPSMRNPDFWGGDILWASSKDMKSKYITDTQMKITCLGAEKLNVLKPGALLMCTRSGILRRTFPIAIAKRRLTINQDLRALTLWLPGIVEYVYLVLTSFEQTILMNYKKAGTTVESIIWDKFIDLPIPLPPLAEQNRIVAKVEEIKVLSKMCAIH